jgi:copper transport protein
MAARPGWGSALAVVAAVLALAVPVAAHSDLQATSPADGERLDVAPALVTLEFDNPLEPGASRVQVTDGQGARVDRGAVGEGGNGGRVLTMGLQEGLPDGGYTVRWSTISADGHPNSGRFAFAVGANATVPDPGGATSAGPAPLSVAGRALSYLGLALGLGAAAWLLVVRPAPEGLDRWALRALAVGGFLAAAGAALVFRATLDSTGLPAATLAAAGTGRFLAVRAAAGLGAALLAAIGLAVASRRRWAAGWAAAFLLAAALSSAAIGHAASHGLPGLAVDAMHLVASATWVGGLLLFFAALRLAGRQGWPAADVRRMGLRFGTLALACVVLLVATGTATTLVVLGATAVTDPLHLLDSLYGRLLLAKVGLAALMVAVAAANRFLYLAEPADGAAGLRGRAARLGPGGTAGGLRRTVAMEAVLGLLVLAVAGGLTAVSPSDHEATHADPAAGHEGHDGSVADAAGSGTSTGSPSPAPAPGQPVAARAPPQRAGVP